MGILKVPVVKGKSTLDIETDELPAEVYKEALLQGLKVILNRGMTKITKAEYPKEEELKAAAMEKAAKTLEDMKAGKIRILGTKAEKTSGAVMTEARRIAKGIIKDTMKAKGIKVSYVEASEITKAANALIAANPALIDQAKEAIAKRDEEAKAVAASLESIVTTSMISEKKKAKVEKDKAEAKAAAANVLSATQAGKTEKVKPQANK